MKRLGRTHRKSTRHDRTAGTAAATPAHPPGHGGGPSHIVLDPLLALHYGFWLRARDALAGWRDGRDDTWARQFAGTSRWWRRRPSPPPVAPTALSVPPTAGPTMWLTGNAHTYLERDQTEFLRVQAWASPWAVEVTRAEAAADRARHELRVALERRAGVPHEPAPEQLARRGPAEVQDSRSTVEARRRREHAALVAQLEGAVADARRDIEENTENARRLRATVEDVFLLTVTRSRRLREYHERRASVYRRAFERRLRRRRVPPDQLAGHPILVERTMPVPPWLNRPCPWLPPSRAQATDRELHEAVASRASGSDHGLEERW